MWRFCSTRPESCFNGPCTVRSALSIFLIFFPSSSYQLNYCNCWCPCPWIWRNKIDKFNWNLIFLKIFTYAFYLVIDVELARSKCWRAVDCFSRACSNIWLATPIRTSIIESSPFIRTKTFFKFTRGADNNEKRILRNWWCREIVSCNVLTSICHIETALIEFVFYLLYLFI